MDPGKVLTTGLDLYDVLGFRVLVIVLVVVRGGI